MIVYLRPEAIGIFDGSRSGYMTAAGLPCFVMSTDSSLSINFATLLRSSRIVVVFTHRRPGRGFEIRQMVHKCVHQCKQKKADRSPPLIRLRAIENYSNTTITTLRFSARPFFVLFDAAGSVSP